MNCPVCNVPLNMTERQGVEIDYCPKCRGVWLDRGELDKIIERAAAETGPGPAPQPSYRPPERAPEPQYRPREPEPPRYPDQGYHQPGHHKDYHHKKRKSFLGDLFDFD
ncbi:MAG: zf-TFIIB domain-containing protein [Deltaproteobacteria bacterium]|nr:zf-TFIIB domain-containing protein [Deltaproteobacteria bacterium]